MPKLHLSITWENMCRCIGCRLRSIVGIRNEMASALCFAMGIAFVLVRWPADCLSLGADMDPSTALLEELESQR